MIKDNKICVVFLQTPEGTHFKPGRYSWVHIYEGREYIESGMALEWDPKEMQPTDEAYRPWDREKHCGGYKEPVETMETFEPIEYDSTELI